MDDAFAAIDAQGRDLESDDRILPLYSVTKTYVAALVHALGVEPGAPIDRWIGTDRLPRAADITVRHLLQHTSGLRDYGALPAYQAAVRAGEPPWSDATFARHTLEQPLLFEPGSGWSYANPGYRLLVEIVERTGGAPFQELLARHVCEPLGLERTRVAEGVFHPTLPDHPAEWVWHRLVLASATDAARFMRSELIRPLLAEQVDVPVTHPLWTRPPYAHGVMIEPGGHHGHTGDGPGFSVACFRFREPDVTACAIVQTHREGDGLFRLIERRGGTG